jgi:hypothetical protein
LGVDIRYGEYPKEEGREEVLNYKKHVVNGTRFSDKSHKTIGALYLLFRRQ